MWPRPAIGESQGKMLPELSLGQDGATSAPFCHPFQALSFLVGFKAQAPIIKCLYLDRSGTFAIVDIYLDCNGTFAIIDNGTFANCRTKDFKFSAFH